MKSILCALVLAAVLLPAVAYAHGGGCRKDSLPRCCHMDHKTGIEHCH